MFYREKSAFTMLELVMVIVVLGILAAMAMPRLGRDMGQNAADNILSAIRYTQHLALIDNKENPSHNAANAQQDWQRSLWQIRFENIGSEWIYKVGSNIDLSANIDSDEAALDPRNGKRMFTTDTTIGANESSNIFLTQEFGINGVAFNNGCANGGPNAPAGAPQHIAFDYLGRPHRGVTQGATHDSRTAVTTADCRINFTLSTGDTFAITINRETGYAQIVDQNAS